MMIRKIALCLLLATPLTASAESWLCIGEKSVGFSDVGEKWGIREFKPNKYIIKKDAGVDANYEVFLFGDDDYPQHSCSAFGDKANKSRLPSRYGLTRQPEMLLCDDTLNNGAIFKFNRKSGHFVATTVTGYVEIYDGAISNDSLTIQIGKCSSI